MDNQDYTSLILYYGREKFYHLMQNTALDALSRFAGDSSFRLFNGFALVLGNRIQEGIRELNPIQSERDLSMAAVLGLMYAHKRCSVIDKDALIALDGLLKEERKKLTANSAYFAAVFLLLSGKFEKAREYADKALKYNPNFVDALVLKGWADLNSGFRGGKNILELFDKALQFGKNFDANLGQMKFHQLNSDFETAISVLNKLSVRYPELNVPLVEKMKCQLASWNWEHALETSFRILNLEPTNIEALRVKILVLLCRDGSYDTAASVLQYLLVAIERVEPANCELLLQIAQLFSRVCGRNRSILENTYRFIDRAVQLSPGNADYITEMGYQLVMLGKYKEATKCFRTATKLDDSSMMALCGLTLCQLSESGPTDQVKQQIEFLTEIQNGAKLPLLLFLTAKTQHDEMDTAIAYLVQSCELQFKNLKTLAYGPEYLRKFDPDFLLQITNELLQYSPIQSTVSIGSTVSKEALHISLKHSLNILEAIVKACPGLVQGVYQLARVEFLCREYTASANTLQTILTDLDSTYTDAHLLMAQIYLQQEQFARAAQTLEVCLSHNFKVRENAMYHLLNGMVQKNQGLLDESLKSFMTAMNSFNNSQLVSPSKSKYKEKSSLLSLSDRVTLHLEVVDNYIKMDQHNEGYKIMQTASEEFANTPEEGRLIIANAEITLQQGNVNKVIALLKTIQPGQPYYLQAKTKLANVYLHKKKDRLAFTQCFKELVENCHGADSFLMLGDAYISIQEPDQAIEAYTNALRQCPHDPMLASKLGRAYVKTHQYAKAIKYYKEAIENPDNFALKLDLAELYLKLKQFTNAEQTLMEEIETAKNDNMDVSALQVRTKQLLLLARVREKAGHLNLSSSTLKEARDNQYRVQKRIGLEQSSGIQEQNKILAKICVLLAEQCISLRDNEQAVHHYKEALKNAPQDLLIMAAIARLYLQMNCMDKCQEMCSMILQIDSNNETASVMMADLSFRRMDFENAAYHFSQLLISQPTYWTALARLIEVMRRSATLQEAAAFLQRAEQTCPNPTQEAGLNYCKGLYEWYTGNPNAALRFFNNSRKDSEWGQQAIFNMIDICLNPDGDLPNESAVELQEDTDIGDSRNMALRTAERLLNELKPRPGGMDNEALNHKLLQNFLLLSSREKYRIESALNNFTAVATMDEYKDHVGPILGMATAHVLLKQGQRARNHLKRIAKNTWTFEDAEYLERCWLLLADLYIQSGRTTMASEHLVSVLDHNKSCVKAHELCGQISEKEQSYRSAAIHYDAAWRFGGKSKPAIGYKLAYNHMKTKNYADAIDVCQQVLKLHPDYPAIKKDILDKCRNNLRS